ncbi:MAG: hypothetical protein FJ293_00280 [Planctomycetes bacterium]|nr:hypothetical protein [Planctomycetota bacterium]
MDWKIERIRERCATCEQPFRHDERVRSAITTDEQQRAVRRDLCGACPPPGGPSTVWWETRWQQPAQRKKKVDFDRLLRVFEAWQKAPPKDSDALLYLITLLLVRKRFLKLVDLVHEDGREHLRLRRPGPIETWYLAPAPLLQPSDLPPLRLRLEELIDGTIEDDELQGATDAATAVGN